MKRAQKVAKKLPETAGPPHLEHRILILAPTGNDAQLTLDFLISAGLTAQTCQNLPQLCGEVAAGAGAVILAEETLEQGSIPILVQTLAAQPSWSDLPIILITSGGEVSQTRLRRLAIFGSGGNVTVLERPFRPATLVSTVEVALRSRQRQYESHQLMEELREARTRIEATLGIADVGTWTWEFKNNRVFADKNMARIFSLSPEEAAGGAVEKYFQKIHPDDRAAAEVTANAALQSESGEYESDYRLQPAQGAVRWVTSRGRMEKDADGQPSRFLGVVIDITARKQAEAILRQNEALFSALVELAPTGMYVVDGQFRLQQINARALSAFAKVERKIGRDFGEVMEILWGPEIGAQLAGIFRHTLATGEAYRSPRFAEHRQDLNEDKAYEWETERVTLPDGTHGVVCFFNDITETERNKANLAFLATIGNDLLRLDTVDDILNTVCAKICDYLKLSSGCFLEINEAADIATVTHEWRRPELPVYIGTYKLSDYLSADFQKVLRAGECFIVRDTVTDPRTDAEKYAQLKIRSFICVPLIADGRWKFLFDIYDSKPRDWREDEIGLVRELTERIWTRVERVRADSVLRQNEALFAALIEEAPVGVYVINAQFRVQQINTRALPAFEKVEPKIGRTLTDVMHIQWGREAGDELAAIFRHTLDTGEPYVSPGYSNIRADLGIEKTFEWQTRRVTLPNGSHGVVCYFNDITERIRSEQALMQAKTAAESASRAKDNFLAALSHELRTPLNPALLIASESADNRELPGEVRLNFETIRKNIELEARLIDDLLDLTRITAGKMILNRDVVNIHHILADALRTVHSDQQEKNIPVTIKLDATHSLVNGDAVRLQQIFWNVLKNAVKFTPANGQITVETGNDAADQIIIKITDNGLGMSATEVTRIFAPFAQGDHARGDTHQFGGLGLGLAIAKNLVELHGGKISARSAGVGLGSVFTIELPAAQKANTRERIERDSKPKASNALDHGANPVSVLLVEDHEITRTVLAQLLTRRNYKVTTADSIASARERAGRQKFDLLISDIGLPDGNGNDLMKEFKEHYGLKGIALTGYGMEEDIARGKAAGFVTHLIKPVTIQSLETALALMK